MMILALVLLTVLAYGLSRGLTGLSRRLAYRLGALSYVDHRSSHQVPTPRLGGLGLAIGFIVPSTGWILLLWYLHVQQSLSLITTAGFDLFRMKWLFLGWLTMLATGVLDDLYDLRPTVKLGLTGLGALTPTLGGRLMLIRQVEPWAPESLVGLLAILLAAGWILFMVHAFNFMDGMDGMAGNFARTAAVFLFGYSLMANRRFQVPGLITGEEVLLLILAAASWGFLAWNRPPARVFMGDGGSLSTGYVLGVLALVGEAGGLGRKVPLLVSVIIMLPFIFDVLLTLLRRMLQRENLLQAHREHLYQRLMQSGLSHQRVLRLNQVIFVICGGAALLDGPMPDGRGQGLGLLIAMGAMVGYWIYTVWRERGGTGEGRGGRPG